MKSIRSGCALAQNAITLEAGHNDGLIQNSETSVNEHQGLSTHTNCVGWVVGGSNASALTLESMPLQALKEDRKQGPGRHT